MAGTLLTSPPVLSGTGHLRRRALVSVPGVEAWACAACSGDNPFGMPFCGHCGRRDEVERTLVGHWGCRGCAGTNADAMVFCGRCGQRRGEDRPEDLRLVTSLFADISGFTTLADTLDVEELHAVINPLIGGLARIAERYDGFVAKYAGDALLCLFGAPTQHEDDAQRALLAAMEMQATLPSLLASLGPVASRLTIHVGVNTGKVVAGAVGSAAQHDYSVLGDSVILAQRLESVCPPGQTYVGESTRELCRGEFDFEDLGELQLKGKLTTVRGFRLVGRRRSGTDASRPLVGREAELGDLLSTVRASGTCVLVGEPGTGKSRLLAEARLRATAEGIRWLPVRCLSYGAALPYWPFTDLVRQALGLRVEDAVEDVLGRLSGALPPGVVAGAARLLGSPVDELEPEAARRQVHDALADMLRVLSGGRRLVLAVEDVHWIDSASADALAELIRTTDLPLGVVLTSRREGRDRALSLAADAEVSREIALAALGPQDVPLVAAAVLGSPVAGHLTALLVERTRGNPLFVEELARSLSEDGALIATSAGLDLRPGFDTDALPDTVERVFAARVDSLPLAAASVLLVAAVIGRVIRQSLLEAVAAEEGTDLAPLADLVAAGLLDRVVEQDEPAVAFHHALLHDAVYGRLLKKQRRSLHRRVADVGRRLYGDGDETVDLLARHLYLAEAGEEAVSALLRAGRRAAHLYANDAAAEHLTRATELIDPCSPQADEVLSELAHLLVLRGDYDAALVRFASLRARRCVPTDWSGEASVLRRQGRYAEAVDLLVEGLTRFPDSEGLALVVELARSRLASGQPAAALGAVRQGLAVAGVADRARLLVELVGIEDDIGHPEFAVAHGRRALPFLRTPGQERELATALRLIGGAQRTLGDLEDAAATLVEAIALSERIGHVEEAAGALVNLAVVHSERGLSDEAVEAMSRAAAIFERLGHASGRAIAYGNLADLVLATGRADEALEWGQRSLELARRIDLTRQVGFALVTIAEVQLARGRTAEADTTCRQARQVFVEMSAENMVEYCDAVLDQVRSAPALSATR